MLTTDNFLNIPFASTTLDSYFIRTSILKALSANLSWFNGRLLDIGCGKMPYKKFILENSGVQQYAGLDIENAIEYDSGVKPDFTWDGITMPFAADEFDCAFGTEVLEHCPDPANVLREVHRVLKPGGGFFFTVPFLWPLHEVPHDAYRYTPFTLDRLLKEAGFKNIEIKATGGWHAAMAQMLGLWVRRSSMGSKKRKLFYIILKPVIRYLLHIEQFSKLEFQEGLMITGLSGVAYK